MTPGDVTHADPHAILIRRAALVVLVLIGPVSALAAWAPNAFGLDRRTALLLGGPATLLNAGVVLWLRGVTASAVARRRVLPLSVVLVGVAAAGLSLSSSTPLSILAGLALFLAFSGLVLDARALGLVTVSAISVAAVSAAISDVLGPDLLAALALVAGIGLLAHFATRSLVRGIGLRDAAIDDAARARRALEAAVAGLRQSASADPARIMHAAVAAAARLTGGWAVMHLADDSIPPVAEVVGSPRSIAGSTAMERLVAATIASPRVRRYTPAGADPVLAATGSSHVVAVPVLHEGRASGALVAGRPEDVAIHDDELGALQVLADHTGIALDLAAEAAADRRAAARLERLDRMKDDVVTTVSHELRTPVTIMTGMAETLARPEGMDAELRTELLQRLLSNGIALKHIVEQLLDAALAREGALDLDLRPVSVAAVVHACSERLAPLLATHAIVVDVGTLDVVADPALLERVVENLLVNAVRHTPPGTRVTVRAVAFADDVEIEVADDGPGIAAHEVERVLDRFGRGGDANARVRGLGIGLSLADDILRQHDTVLRVSSTAGGGATFSFRLPRPDAARAELGRVTR